VLNIKYLLLAVGSRPSQRDADTRTKCPLVKTRTSPGIAHSANDAVRTGADLLRRFASGAAVVEQVPARALLANFVTPATFIFAIIPLDEGGIDLGQGAKPRQFACLACTLQRTREHLCESQPLQTFTESPGGALAMFGEWKVSKPGMLAR